MTPRTRIKPRSEKRCACQNLWRNIGARKILGLSPPVAVSPVVARSLPQAALSDPPSENLPGLDDDLLDHWLERCRGRSALQYLFMGGVGTRSRLHVDPGVLDLIIAPLVGWKEVTLVHRDDAELVGAMCSDSAQEVERGKRTR